MSRRDTFKSERHVALSRAFPPSCPPCSGNCSQGRACRSHHPHGARRRAQPQSLVSRVLRWLGL